MYWYKTKHKVLSLLLVFSLLILTTVLVFPSPVLAWDGVWDHPDKPIIVDMSITGAPQHFSGPIVPPLPEVNKLRLIVTPPIIPIADFNVWFSPTNYSVNLQYSGSWWSTTHAITVTPGPPDIIEVTFAPPIPVDQVCLVNNFLFPGLVVSIEPLQLLYSTPNQAPVADADGPYSGSVGSSISFNGSASNDPDEPYGDQIVSWEWDLNGDGQYDDASGEIVQKSWGSPYSGSIGLNVTDTLGAWDTDETRVNVTLAPTPPPVEVGGNVYPVDRLAILIPGLTLAAILIVGTAVVMRRRRARY